MAFGSSDTPIRYGSYLKVPELISLQQPFTEEHDELQFIVLHQVYELWFRLILHELDAAEALLLTGTDESIREATRLLHRVARIQDVLLSHLPVMETMRPGDFLRFRERLKPASGFQSAQFREMEFLCGLKSQALLDRCDADDASMARLRKRFAAPTLRERFAALATRRGFAMTVAEEGSPEHSAAVGAIVELYKNPALDTTLYELAEALLDIDERLALWRSRHYWMVERVIGGTIGTGYAATGAGYEGIRYLSQTLFKKAFPELWSVRGRLGGAPA